MEQVSLFLTEYSSWIAAAWALLVVLLLAVTSHRIKKIERQLREAVGRIKRRATDKPTAQSQVAQRTAKPEPMTEAALQSQVLARKQVSQGAAAPMAKEEQGALIDAVLGEIFP